MNRVSMIVVSDCETEVVAERLSVFQSGYCIFGVRRKPLQKPIPLRKRYGSRYVGKQVQSAITYVV